MNYNFVGSRAIKNITPTGRNHIGLRILNYINETILHRAGRSKNEISYFFDGQIREEVYVKRSIMQSKMYEQGVTCTNCHEPHSGKTLVKGNGQALNDQDVP